MEEELRRRRWRRMVVVGRMRMRVRVSVPGTTVSLPLTSIKMA